MTADLFWMLLDEEALLPLLVGVDELEDSPEDVAV